MLRNTILLASLLILVAVPAGAEIAVPIPAPSQVTLSFASDDNDDGPTFRGISGGNLIDGGPHSANGFVDVDLMVDTNGDAAGGVTVVPSLFFFSGSISNYTLNAATNGFVTQWDVSGSFVFVEPFTGLTLLTVSFNNALMTTYSPNIATLGQTASLQDSNDVDTGLVMTPTARFTTLTGVGSFTFSNSEDFAFTFTHLRNIDGGGGLPMIDHGTFLRNWVSEGSFSAHASSVAVLEDNQ